MACYTLSKCIKSSLEIGKKYITDLIMVFTQESNPCKIAIDKTNRVISIYETIGQENEFFANWLTLMSYQPSNFETINISINDMCSDEEVFLKVCSSTKSQNKIIVHSHEGWENVKYENGNTILYNDIPITVLDRDEAILELNTPNSSTINAYGSVVATDNSSIHDTRNRK